MAPNSATGTKLRLAPISRGRLKTAAILLLVFAGNLLLLTAASHYIVLAGFDRLERQIKVHHLAQFQGFLNNEIEQLTRTAGDYAGWNAAYDFVAGQNPAFVENHLHDAIFPQLRLNIFLYADNIGRVRYAKAVDYREQRETVLPPALLARLQTDRLFFHSTAESRRAGILVLPEGLLMVASHPVLHSDYSGPVAGTLLLGRFLDAAEVARIAALLQLPVTFFRDDAAELPAEIRGKLPLFPAGVEHLIVDGVTTGYLLLPDVSGERSFVLRAEKERLIYHQGLEVINFFLLWAAGISIAAGLVIFFLIERLKTEKQRLWEEHALLEGIIGSSEDLIVALDTDFRYLIFNRAYAQEYHRLFAAEAKIGSSLGATLAHAPAGGEAEFFLWKRALQGEAFTHVSELGLDEHRRTFEMKFTPLSDAAGRVTAAACIARDMTERLREERALRESEQRFRVFFNNVAVGTVQLGSQGHFIRVNDRFCRMTGYSREELLQMTPEDLDHPEEKVRETFRQFLLGEASTYRVEKRCIRKDGEVIWVEMAAGLVHDERGRPLRTMGIVQEISARKRLEEELRTATRAAEAASRAKSEFLATMSHEIRTPMTIFMVALEHLLEIDRDPERRQFLEMADGAARRLRVLIDDILDFSRIEAGRLEIDEHVFDLRECVAHCVGLLTVSARDKGLRLTTEVGADVPPLLVGDPDRIGQVLINLIGNAIKFTETGEVLVTVERCDDLLCFSVVDSGMGVPAGKSDMLFQHFSQVDSSLTRRHGGTGLGLAISKGLVELMGGCIGFRNRTEGGSIFHFTLPLKTVASPPVSGTVPAAESGAYRHPAVRILLAEDEPTVRVMIQMLLQQNGWEIGIASDGREAVERWRAERHDLIFMDVQMPGVDGLEAARQIRRLEKEGEKRTCIIGLTAHADSAMQKNCFAAGMDNYLSKPVRMGDLFAAIDRCFSTRDRSQQPVAQGE